MRLAAVRDLPNSNIFKWNDPSRFLVCGELEVIEAVVIQDEPASLPGLVPATLLPEPTLPVRIEERVHQIVAVVFRNLKRFRLDRLVQGNEELAR